MSLWQGRFKEGTDKLVQEFTSSIAVDRKLYKYDIMGSIAHAKMLAKCGIISSKEANKIIQTLEAIQKDIQSGRLTLDGKEDIHLGIEEEIIRRLGKTGEKLHTARSRNDQIALDERLYLRDEIGQILDLIVDFQKTHFQLAKCYSEVILPGYTHLQYAQPILLSHYFLAYFWMLQRDKERLKSCLERVNVMPLGAGALAGTSLPIDRDYVADLLDFPKITENSVDTVSDRDYLLEFLGASAVLMMHLSRLSEDLILWSSSPFGFIEIRDAFATGSSLIPHKKNPDVAELIRGKTGRVYGSLMSLLTVMKGLPLSYNRDMQEDKLPLLETVEIVRESLRIYTQILKNIRINAEQMEKEAREGFFASTDLVDYLVQRGVPFREAHQLLGRIVRHCLKTERRFEDLSLEEYRRFSSLFEKDLFERMKLEECVFTKESAGGTGKRSLKIQMELAKQRLEETI